MLTPLGLFASMIGTMLGCVLLCWMGVSLADLVMRLLGRAEAAPAPFNDASQKRWVAKRFCEASLIRDMSHPVSRAAGDAVYSSGMALGTHFDPFIEITPASLRQQLGPAGVNPAARCRFDAEGKFRIDPSEN